jgi:chromatin remodeling complex protein RSC6
MPNKLKRSASANSVGNEGEVDGEKNIQVDVVRASSIKDHSHCSLKSSGSAKAKAKAADQESDSGSESSGDENDGSSSTDRDNTGSIGKSNGSGTGSGSQNHQKSSGLRKERNHKRKKHMRRTAAEIERDYIVKTCGYLTSL